MSKRPNLLPLGMPTAPDIGELTELSVDEWVARGGDADGNVVRGSGESVDLRELSARECVLENLSFANTAFQFFEASDVIFRNCDFAGVEVSPGSRLTRVRFDEVRGIGLQLSGTKLHDVLFVRGTLNMALVRMADVAHIAMAGVNAAEIDFSGSTINVGVLANCDLRGAAFDGVKCHNLALHGSEIDGSSGLAPGSGLVISQEQLTWMAVSLAKDRGITVDDQALDGMDLAF